MWRVHVHCGGLALQSKGFKSRGNRQTELFDDVPSFHFGSCRRPPGAPSCCDGADDPGLQHQPGDAPNAMNARYYAQRASAALIVSEATQVSPQGKGYSFTPGIYPSSSEISLILRPLMPPLSLTRLKYAILALPSAL